MKIILIKPVRKLGKVGDIVNVSNGYADNYLLPQEFAIYANKENIADLAKMQKDLDDKNAKNKLDAQKIAESLKNSSIKVITESASDGRLFGSVNSRNLASKISKLAGVELNYSNIILDFSIKFNGVYEIEVVLHPEIIVPLLVVVSRSDSEAQALLLNHKEENTKKEETDKTT